MPVEYPSTGGLVAEHKAVRASVGVFDVSHMGDIRIATARAHGGALAAVQHITMNDAAKLAIGQAQYSAMLYPSGTFVDDVIVHRLGDDDFLLVINAGTREKESTEFRRAASGARTRPAPGRCRGTDPRTSGPARHQRPRRKVAGRYKIAFED